MRFPQRIVAVFTAFLFAIGAIASAPSANAQLSSSSSMATSPFTKTFTGSDIASTEEVVVGDLTNNNTTWGFLQRPGTVIPGAKIYNRAGGACTAGWVVDKQGETFVTTAAHCGTEGESFRVADSNGHLHQFGTMTDRSYGIGEDIGLIKVTDNALVDATIPVTNFDFSTTMTPQQVQETQPTLCLLGQNSGLSCGPFYNVDSVGRVNFTAKSSHGDSGAPVFALIGPELHPVALLKGGYAGGEITASQPITADILAGATVLN